MGPEEQSLARHVTETSAAEECLRREVASTQPKLNCLRAVQVRFLVGSIHAHDGTRSERERIQFACHVNHRRRVGDASGTVLRHDGAVTSDPRPRRDAGSRGFLDSLRHPVTAATAPFRRGRAASEEDLDAARTDVGVSVTCFIRAGGPPLPQRWKQGVLEIRRGRLTWVPGLKPSGAGIAILPSARVLAVREVRGWEHLYVKARFFRVVEAVTETGPLWLGVPGDSVDLVTRQLS